MKKIIKKLRLGIKLDPYKVLKWISNIFKGKRK